MAPGGLAYLFSAFLLSACAREPGETASGAPGLGGIRLATTTSTENTGLLKALLPPFEKRFGAKVSVLAVGTGKAIDLSRNGDADLVLAHAQALEEKFVADGFGVNRRPVMHNDFVVVGPEGDPAGIKGCADAAAAFAKIAASGAAFISRGDKSGTHVRELDLWKAAGSGPPGQGRYIEAGQGMGEILVMADEKSAYTLSDRGTFIAMGGKTGLKILCEGGPALLNPYSAIAVNPAVHPKTNYLGAMALIAWLTSPEGQAIIAAFRKDGLAMFIPDAIPAK